MKRITFRKVPGSLGRRVDCSYGGVYVGYVQASDYGWYWVVYGDRIGIETHNSLWGERAFSTSDEAKADCKTYIQNQLKLLEAK